MAHDELCWFCRNCIEKQRFPEVDEIYLCWNRENVDREKMSYEYKVLRFLIVEFLRGFVDDVVFLQHLDQFFKEMASKSALAEHWVKNLIKLVFLMMLYVCTEGDGEFGLHVYA